MGRASYLASGEIGGTAHRSIAKSPNAVPSWYPEPALVGLDKAYLVQAWRHRRDGKACGGKRWSERDEGSSRHADNAELNGEQKAKKLQNNPAAGFVTLDPAYGDRNAGETERRFQTEVPSTPNERKQKVVRRVWTTSRQKHAYRAKEKREREQAREESTAVRKRWCTSLNQ